MYEQGDIVLIPVPFTDLSSSKKRPVLILSSGYYNKNTDDLIVAAITSNIDKKPYIIEITSNDLSNGNLLHKSCVRADKLYTLSQSIVIKKFGTLKSETLAAVIEMMYKIFMSSEDLMETEYPVDMDKPWYHGSNIEFEILKEGSTITQWRELAEAFAAKPTNLSYGDICGAISHNGTERAILYVIDEPLTLDIDIYQHPHTSMHQGVEFLTRRPLKLKRIL